MKKLIIIDFDKTLAETPAPETGVPQYNKKTGSNITDKNWWDELHSMDLDVFNIKLNPVIVNIIKKYNADKDTLVAILTDRAPKFKDSINSILKKNNVNVDDIVLRHGGLDKGDILLRIARYNPDLLEIDVYDDFAENKDSKKEAFLKIADNLSEYEIDYNVYYVDGSRIDLIYSNNIINEIINTELKRLI